MTKDPIIEFMVIILKFLGSPLGLVWCILLFFILIGALAKVCEDI